MRITVRASTFFALFIAVLLGLGVLASARYFGWLKTTPPAQAVTAIKIERPKVLTAKRNLNKGYAPSLGDVQVREMTDEEVKDFRENPDKYLPPTVEAANLRVLLVGLPQSQIDRLEAMQVVPGLVPRENVFDKFEVFRRELPGIIAKLG